MKKTLSKNFKIAMIALFAAALFVSLNYCLWDNANADDEGISMYGRETNYHEYEFVRDAPIGWDCGTLTHYDLDWDHKPCRHYGDKGWKGFDLDGHSYTWSGDNSDHPWAEDVLYFGGDEKKANDEQWIGKLEFAYAGYADTFDQKHGNDCFIVHYDLCCECSVRIKITFGLWFEKDGVMHHEQCWDSFVDTYDGGFNSEILERAGRKAGYGYDLTQAANEAGCGNKFWLALETGAIKVTVDKIVCQQKCHDTWSTYCPNWGLSKLNVPYITPMHGVKDGHKDTNVYKYDNGDYIKNVQLRIDIEREMLSVYFDAGVSDPFPCDVDYMFTVVALNKDGHTIDARFRAEGDSVEGPDCEEIWQDDCIEGDKTIVENPSKYDGTFYVERVDVSD